MRSRPGRTTTCRSRRDRSRRAPRHEPRPPRRRSPRPSGRPRARRVRFERVAPRPFRCSLPVRKQLAQYTSVDGLNSRPAANSLAVWPLAFHSRTRSDHFASVSVMRAACGAERYPKERGSSSQEHRREAQEDEESSRPAVVGSTSARTNPGIRAPARLGVSACGLDEPVCDSIPVATADRPSARAISIVTSPNPHPTSRTRAPHQGHDECRCHGPARSAQCSARATR